MDFLNLDGDNWDDQKNHHSGAKKSIRNAGGGTNDVQQIANFVSPVERTEVPEFSLNSQQSIPAEDQLRHMCNRPGLHNISGTDQTLVDSQEINLFEHNLSLPYALTENDISAEASQIHTSVSQDYPTEFYSPAMSYQETPLLSPNAASSPAPSSLSKTMLETCSEYGNYYPQSRTRKASGKIAKQSPSVRAHRSLYLQDEGDFQLGDPALDAIDLVNSSYTSQPVESHQGNFQAGVTTSGVYPKQSGYVNQDVEERIQSALSATLRARSRSRSNSIHSNTSTNGRASAASSNRNTPRIRPKINGSGSAEMSPLMTCQDTKTDHLEEAFLKSNYHSLIDGTYQHLGLNSAEQLASDLRSKKTIHKLAEQERRQRMNLAISELSSLLGPGDDKSVISKAATVERAIVHIKKLRKRIAQLELLCESRHVDNRGSFYSKGLSSENSLNTESISTPGNNNFSASSEELSPVNENNKREP